MAMLRFFLEQVLAVEMALAIALAVILIGSCAAIAFVWLKAHNANM